MQTSINNKHIVKNTAYLYVRLVVSLAIGLFTSRIILSALGVSDYGIYNIVGGFVSMLSLFTISLSGATSRFITFELGRGDMERMKKTFATLSTLVYLLAVIVLILGETVGLWFVKEYLLIPDERWKAALFLYHCSLLAFIVNLIALPYNSCVIAHEKMNFFAIVSVLDSVLKLGIVYMLYISPFDRLRTYAVLLVAIGVIIRIIYIIYCKHTFEEAKVKWGIDKNIFKDIFSYSAWITIGASSAIFKEQGVNVLVNMFFGVLFNAARGISMQVYGVVSQFSYSIGQAITPQITKEYAVGNLPRAISLTFILAKVQGILIMTLSLPLLLETNYVLGLWLGEFPDYTVAFMQWALILCYTRTLEDTHGTLYLATGNVKCLQIIGGGLMLLNIPIDYVFLKQGFEPIITMIIGAVLEVVTMFVAFMYLKKIVKFPILCFYREAVLPQLVVCGLSLIFPLLILSFWKEACFLRFCLVSIVSVFMTIGLSYLIVLNIKEKNLIIEIIKSKLKGK